MLRKKKNGYKTKTRAKRLRAVFYGLKLSIRKGFHLLHTLIDCQSYYYEISIINFTGIP